LLAEEALEERRVRTTPQPGVPVDPPNELQDRAGGCLGHATTSDPVKGLLSNSSTRAGSKPNFFAPPQSPQARAPALVDGTACLPDDFTPPPGCRGCLSGDISRKAMADRILARKAARTRPAAGD